ncbi:uncharacterized protein V2V93DRAFT_376266 [Kockiozyma suomiensis]|uniref:uncharacterized protein n=1 Tax=Kockiozyma suomiensis TaxID=1337062 RepID=UPI003343106C
MPSLDPLSSLKCEDPDISSEAEFHRLRAGSLSRTPSLLAAAFSPSASPPSRRRRQSGPYSHSESLVGSYEESLLAGRTSTPSSKPAVRFVARIGVLGTGEDCPAKLRCPRHVSLEFEAVYYNWLDDGDASRGSPYVGILDLEQYYAEKQCEKPLKKRVEKAVAGYRIPSEGQLQIVISNPHRTAIKLFLVPYDLKEMPVGTRTFIRQKTMVNDQPADKGQGKEKGSLRQAVHLHVVHASKGHYYLFRTLRVVFENRAIDATTTTPTMAMLRKDNMRVESIMGDFSTFSADSQLRRRSSSRLSCTSLMMTPRESTREDAIIGDEYGVEDDEHQQTSPGLSSRLSKLSVSVSAEDLAWTPTHSDLRIGLGISDSAEISAPRESRDWRRQVDVVTWKDLYDRRLGRKDDP